MKHLLIVLACLFVLPVQAFADLPKTIAGITIGDDVSRYSGIVLPETAMGNRDAMFVDEVDINPEAIPGIRGGSITSGNCVNPGKVIGVKLKFVDRSLELYEALEKEYRRLFGTPDVWLGDAFHNVISWQWMLEEGDERLEIVLTYSKDQEIRPGVSIKMVLRSAWDKEMEMFRAQSKQLRKHKFMMGDYTRSKLEPFLPK